MRTARPSRSGPRLDFVGPVLVLLVASLGNSAFAQSRANIVLVLVDDLRADVVDSPRVPTPAIDRLEREGATFTRAFVTTSLCSPSRASLLTGVQAHAHGVRGNVGLDPRPELPTVASELREAGYSTAFVGKWHMARRADPRPGFDHWVSFVGQGRYRSGELNVDGESESFDGYITDEITSRARSFLGRRQERPFFLFVSHKAVHAPFTPAPRHASLEVRDAPRSEHRPGDRLLDKHDWGRRVPPGWKRDVLSYHRAIAAVDESLGTLLDTIDRRGLTESTVVVFTSDNGYLHGEHGGLWDKRAAYEPSIRVPLVVRYPGRAEPGSRLDALVTETDLFPGFLEIAGRKPPAHLHGRSWLPALGGAPGRDAFLYAYFREPDRFSRPSILALRTRAHKLITYPDLPDAPVELYDLDRDPDELDNRAREVELAPLRAELQARLEREKASIGFRVPEGVPEASPAEQRTPRRERRDDRPNVIFILADDLGYAELGCYGQTKIRTPSIDRLASEGMRFTQHYSGSTVCAPSRCVLLTGLHTGHSWVRDNWEAGGWGPDEPEGQDPLPRGTVTIGTTLQGVGYRTGAIGKWGLGGPDSTGQPNLQGFDHFYGYLCQRVAHNYYPTHLWRNGERHELGNEWFSAHQRLPETSVPEDFARFRGRTYAMDEMAREARQFIRTHHRRPFFLYLPFPVPHVAIQVPEDSLAEYDGAFDEKVYRGEKAYLPHPKPRAGYAAMITRMDREIGTILALLDELAIAERTIVFFSSDNGPTFNGGSDSAFFASAGRFRGLKCDLYEGGIRVPLIARWPGRITPGAVSDHISGFQDLLPTLAELSGAPIPARTDGLSLVPTLLGEGTQRRHEFLYWEYHARGAMQAARVGRWKGLRLNARADPDGPIEVYDLTSDPGETSDVAGKHPDVVARMRQIFESRTPAHRDAWNFPPLPRRKSD